VPRRDGNIYPRRPRQGFWLLTQKTRDEGHSEEHHLAASLVRIFLKCCKNPLKVLKNTRCNKDIGYMRFDRIRKSQVRKLLSGLGDFAACNMSLAPIRATTLSLDKPSFSTSFTSPFTVRPETQRPILLAVSVNICIFVSEPSNTQCKK